MAAAIPLDPCPLPRSLESRLAHLRQAALDLETGHGRYAKTPEDQAARALADARRGHGQAEDFARLNDMNWRSRRYWRRSAREWAAEEATAQERFERSAGPEMDRLERTIGALEKGRVELMAQMEDRNEWLSTHPEADRRLDYLDHEIDRATPKWGHALDDDLLRTLQQHAVRRERDFGAELDLVP